MFDIVISIIIKAIKIGMKVQIDDYQADLDLIRFKQDAQEKNLYNFNIR